MVQNNGGLRTGSCGEEGNAHSPPDIHYGKEPNKRKRLMRRSIPAQETGGKAKAEQQDRNQHCLFPASTRRVKVAVKPMRKKYGQITKIHLAVTIKIHSRIFDANRLRLGIGNNKNAGCGLVV